MSLSNYILAFAELLEKGTLLAKDDTTQNVGLKPEDHPMHVILANVLRKSLNSPVMASIADDFHAGFNKMADEKKLLQDKLHELLGKNDDPVEAPQAPNAELPTEPTDNS